MKQKLKLLVSKRAIFTYVSYPLIFFVANKLTQIFMAANIKAEERDYYGYLALLISVVAIFLFLTEGFKKIYSYSLQGEKLKIRVSEGISVKEMNESKK